MGAEGSAFGQDGMILHLPNKGNFVVAAFGFRIDPGADDAIPFESLKASPKFFAWLVPPRSMNKKTVKAVNLVVECKTFMSDVLWFGERESSKGLRIEFV